MKILRDNLPEACVVVIGILCGFCFVRFGMSSMHQVLTYLALFVLLVILRVARKSVTGENPALPTVPVLENPREFKQALIHFCDNNMTNFHTVPSTLTAEGPMSHPPDTNLAGPSDIDLYFEAIDSLGNVDEDISRFVTKSLECRIVRKEMRGIPPNRALVIEADRDDHVGTYVFVVSPAEIPYHFRIQVGLVLPA